jgi:hypothetical protein
MSIRCRYYLIHVEETFKSAAITLEVYRGNRVIYTANHREDIKQSRCGMKPSLNNDAAPDAGAWFPPPYCMLYM